MVGCQDLSLETVVRFLPPQPFMKGLMIQLKIKRAAYRVLSFVGVVVFLGSLFAMPVSAADANNNEFFDFDEYAEYYPHDDGSVGVVVDFPEDWFRTLIYEKNYDGKNFIKTMKGFYIPIDFSVDGATLLIRPLGSNLFSGGAVGQQVKNAHFIDLRYIPKKTTISFDFFVSMWYEYGYAEDAEEFDAYQVLYFVDENGKVVKRSNKYVKPEVITDAGNLAFSYYSDVDLSVFEIPDNAVGLIPVFLLYDTLEENYQINYIQFDQPQFSFSMTDLESDLVQNQRLQNLKTAVQSALAEQDKKLDNILTGGEAGQDLAAGGDRLESAGSDMGDDLGQIQDFEDQYMGQLDDNMDDVIKGAELTWIYPALAFVQRYLNKIVAGIPSKYLIVFTLPMFFGLFMYIVGHPVRAPRPDTSGDQVTRETFTTTEILTGKGAGNIRTTRTTTTSREIGRVRDE